MKAARRWYLFLYLWSHQTFNINSFLGRDHLSNLQGNLWPVLCVIIYHFAKHTWKPGGQFALRSCKKLQHLFIFKNKKNVVEVFVSLHFLANLCKDDFRLEKFLLQLEVALGCLCLMPSCPHLDDLCATGHAFCLGSKRKEVVRRTKTIAGGHWQGFTSILGLQ
jgi:hypothetical protein